MSQHVVVIGAGVIGLSAALALQEAGYAVTVLAKDFPAPFETIDPQAQINFTSPWGGAHNRWVPPAGADQDRRDHRLALRTFRRMAELAASHPEAGITFMPGVEYLEAPGPEYAALTEAGARALGIEGFRRLRPDELPDARVKWGCEYRTWCVNPMVYCAFLLRRLRYRGGRLLKRELRDPEEVFALGDLLGDAPPAAVVNCSGSGFGDPDVFVLRGQTCLVANPCAATVTRQNADGSWTFCVPRNFEGGTVIGGTKEPGDWDARPSAATRQRLLDAFAATHPAILGPSGRLRVLGDVVGRRPARRGGARIEAEPRRGAGPVVHAYGLGGRGYEMSWGVADMVVDLVRGQTAGQAKL